jgi:hypothetical protein
VTAGDRIPEPGRLFESNHLRQVLNKLEFYYDIGESIVQNGFGELHVAGNVQLVVGIIQRIQPPERLNRFLAQVIVKTYSKVVVYIVIGAKYIGGISPCVL